MSTAVAPDGTVIDWTSSGSGMPVILVHGITEDRTFWAPVTERLETSHQVIALDLRGHGLSGLADAYNLAELAGDVVAVATAAGVELPHLVGHSLGGTVVSVLGASFPVASIVNVDQSLQLDAFHSTLQAVEPLLRDPETFPGVLAALFDELNGPLLSAETSARMAEGRKPVQEVVLGIWDLVLTTPAPRVAAIVDAILAGHKQDPVPYLSLFGNDPGREYSAWLEARIPLAQVEFWPDHGHFPHIVDPDRFVARLREFWTEGAS